MASCRLWGDFFDFSVSGKLGCVNILAGADAFDQTRASVTKHHRASWAVA